MSEITPREQLKKDIIAYLRSVGVTERGLIAKALDVVKSASNQTLSIDKDIRREYKEFFKAHPMADGAEFYWRITWNFSPSHYDAIAAFVKRFEEIEYAESEAQWAIEDAIDEEIDRQHDPLGDSEYDELGTPDMAVCVYETHIEVRAYCSGMGEILPKRGRKYIGSQGDIRWRYPLSFLSELERLGRPVVKVAELQEKLGET